MTSAALTHVILRPTAPDGGLAESLAASPSPWRHLWLRAPAVISQVCKLRQQAPPDSELTLVLHQRRWIDAGAPDSDLEAAARWRREI